MPIDSPSRIIPIPSRFLDLPMLHPRAVSSSAREIHDRIEAQSVPGVRPLDPGGSSPSVFSSLKPGADSSAAAGAEGRVLLLCRAAAAMRMVGEDLAERYGPDHPLLRGPAKDAAALLAWAAELEEGR